MNELKDKLIALCNESGLPLEAILFVARDFYRDVEESYRLASQMAEKQKEEVE